MPRQRHFIAMLAATMPLFRCFFMLMLPLMHAAFATMIFAAATLRCYFVSRCRYLAAYFRCCHAVFAAMPI